MNPKRLLTLWRERWAKPDVSRLQVPYIDGRVSQWGMKIAQKMHWSLLEIFIFIPFLLVWCLQVFFAVLLPLDSQIIFSSFLLLCALFIRIQAGVIPTLILMGMSVLVSARYLYWRINTTLGQDFDAAFGFGFTLLLLEFYFCLQALLNFIANRWPIKRDQSNLRGDSHLWPSIDVFILCEGKSLSIIELAIKSATSFEWPKQKVKVYLLDDDLREDIKELAGTTGSHYSHADLADPLSRINAGILDSKGDFVVVLECDKMPGSAVLKSTVGWFLRDVKLGMLLSPQHFLISESSKLSIDLFDSCDLNQSFAMIRRTMLLRLGDEQSQLVTNQARLSQEMRYLGYESAFVGLPRIQVSEHEGGAFDGEQPSPSLHYFRVDQPVLNTRLLVWRLRLFSLQVALDFYQPAVRLAFMMAPLPYLLSGINIIQSDSALFGAYVAPHLLHWYMAKGRLENNKRISLWTDFKETSLAIYLMALTSIAFIQAEVGKLKNKKIENWSKSKPSFDWLLSTPWGLVTVLNLLGLAMGLVNFPFDDQQEWAWACLYIFWSIANLLVLAAIAAVAEETRHVRHFSRQQSERSIVLRLPLGRSLVCVTENFPSKNLELKLPTTPNLSVGSAIQVSLFKDEREFGFPAFVDSKTEGKMSIRILESAQADYAAFVEAVYSRGKNWPNWLPGRNADSPLPRWLYKLIEVLRTAPGSWLKNFSSKLSQFQLTSFWKKKK